LVAHSVFARLLASASIVLITSIGMVVCSALPTRADQAATAHECYRSIRSCQKSRCGSAAGSDQVSCMRQCNKEYETCVSGAGTGTSSGFPTKLETPRTTRKRDIPRRQRQQNQNQD
jgi:hypothetical protein